MNKLESLYKKARNIDLEAYEAGKKNYTEPKLCIEQKARQRAQQCKQCEHNIIEPIERFKIKDSIKAISERSCSACGCLLPYLLRQNLKQCKLKKWK